MLPASQNDVSGHIAVNLRLEAQLRRHLVRPLPSYVAFIGRVLSRTENSDKNVKIRSGHSESMTLRICDLIFGFIPQKNRITWNPMTAVTCESRSLALRVRRRAQLFPLEILLLFHES
jgi:hypothetical protein